MAERTTIVTEVAQVAEESGNAGVSGSVAVSAPPPPTVDHGSAAGA